MTKFKQHVFICTNTRPPFAKPSCGLKDSNPIVALMKEAVEKNGLQNKVKITGCGCLGPCEDGPMMVVYPDGIWYCGVKPEDVVTIINNHMINDTPVKKLQYHWPETNEL